MSDQLLEENLLKREQVSFDDSDYAANIPVSIWSCLDVRMWYTYQEEAV